MKAANIRASAAVAAFVGAIPAVAVAEETSGADILIPKPAEFIPALIIFLIIWFLLAKLAWPKVLSMLDTREKTIQASIDEANETKEKASEIRDQADAVIADARRQASEIVLAARGDAEKERARIVADAHAEAEEVITKARERADDEMRRAYANATDSIAKVSVAVASRIVGDTLADDEAKQREIIKKYISEVTLNG